MLFTILYKIELISHEVLVRSALYDFLNEAVKNINRGSIGLQKFAIFSIFAQFAGKMDFSKLGLRHFFKKLLSVYD